MEKQARTPKKEQPYVPSKLITVVIPLVIIGLVITMFALIAIGNPPAWVVIAVPVVVLILAVFSLVSILVGRNNLRREREAILRGYPSTPRGKAEAPAPLPLTSDQKIDA